MLRDTAAKRYAAAAFELARDRGELDLWERDLAALAAAFEPPGARAFIASQRIPASAKEDFLRRAGGEPSPLVWNLVRLLSQKGKLSLLPQITEAFQELLDGERGVAHARVLTAVEMSDDERTALARRLSDLTGKTVDVKAYVEPEILGGLVARIGDRLIDGSTRTKLTALKRRLEGAVR